MAGNISEEKLYYQDTNNVILVDPNKVYDADGRPVDRLVQHENLITYANLTCNVIPRTKLAVGENFQTEVRQILLAKINFLKPSDKPYLDTTWTDELLGDYGNIGNTNKPNQSSEEQRKNLTNSNYDTQLLGITSISIRNNKILIPEVNIELVDIQGRALFEKGEKSPYAAFFQLPYPLFNLTVKGYYGKAVKYELNLVSFNARFNPSDGNYQISLKLVGRTPALFSDINLSYMYALPFMYPSTLSVDTTTNNQATSSSAESLQTTTTEETTRGYQKLKEVYSVYKSKGLIPLDFPELTLNQLRTKLDILINQQLNSFGSEYFGVLSDIARYEDDLETFYKSIFGTSSASWINKWTNKNIYFTSNSDITTRYYPINSSGTTLESIKTELGTLITDFTRKLTSNPTLGTEGKYSIGKVKDKSSSIDVSVKVDDIIVKDAENINFAEKFRQENNGTQPTPAQIQTYIQKFISSKSDATYIDPKNLQVVENYGLVQKGQNIGFEQKIAQIRKVLKEKTEEIEKALTEALLVKIVDPNFGLGFNPTIRNVMAVIMAQVDAFLRLMDDVHTKAWSVRKDETRLNSILSAPSTDSTIPIPPEDRIIYPWPSYTEVKDVENKIIVKYPGDSTAFQKTQAYNFEVWPEVEFVEQFVSAILREQPEPKPPIQNSGQNPPYLSSNALEFPFRNLPYLNLTDVSVIYELFERTMSSSYYIGLMKGDDKQELYKVLGDFEKYNLTQQISTSISLLELFKKTPLNYQNYEAVMRSISNDGTGLYWNQFVEDIYTTSYINEQLKTNSSIYSIKSLGNNSPSVQGEQTTTKNLSEFLKSTDSTINDILNTYPFDYVDWCNQNLASFQGNNLNNFYDTTKVLNFYLDKKVISNFTDPKSSVDIRPFTYFNWTVNKSVNETGDGTSISTIKTADNLRQYFINKLDNSKKVVLEGSLNYTNYNNKVLATQTTSILNTPYFINAFSEGIQKMRENNSHPLKAAAYLFLNSLPLSTTLEKYITKKESTQEYLNYIASTITKFSGIHKLPYMWVLKYGSIWNRYKTFIEKNEDFLDTSWTNIDYRNLYDPVNGDISKIYSSSTLSYQMVTQLDSITDFSVGFYPQLVDDMMYLYLGKNVFKNYTDSEFQSAIFQGLKINKNETSKFSQVNGTNNFNSLGYYSYFDLSTLTDLKGLNIVDYMLFPSVGGLRFNQTSLEYQNEGTISQYLISNNSYYNGTVRMSWNSPNFGYFNTSSIVKPRPDQYMKVVQPSLNDVQDTFTLGNQYSSIDELFGVFDKETLDLFEDMFLKFCEHPLKYQNQKIGEGDFRNILTDSLSQEVDNFKFKNFAGILQEFFRVTPSGLSTGTTELSYQLSNLQEEKIINHITKLMDLDVVLKIGNCGNYDRQLFNTISGSNGLVPVNPIKFSPYVLNTVPTNGGTLTLAQSKTNNPDAWITLQEYVGFSTIDKLVYSDQGSYITDFFPTMNIEFSADNIRILHKIIKVFANEKLKNNNLTKTQFQTIITDYVTGLNEDHEKVLNYTLQQVTNSIPTVIPNQTQIQTSLDGDVVKNDLWRLFKALDEKWISGGNYKEKTLFEEFLFFDRKNRDIGQLFVIDVYSIKKYLADKNEKTSLINFISGIFEQNRFNFFALPSYVNFYGVQEPGLNSGPTLGGEDIASLAFGTFLEVDYQDSKPKYLCQFVGKLSEHLQIGENYYFGSDGLSFDNPTENTLLDTNLNQDVDLGLNNKVVAFAVDFGIQNQNIFTSLALDQSQHKVTAESLDILMGLANQYNSNSALPQPQGLYDLYKSRSYTCDVESMGCMLIQPTMYFQLRNVPMFSGAYLILSVEHDIRTGGEFSTRFKGTKISKYEDETPEQLIASINRSYINKIKDRIKKYKSEADFVLATTVNDQSATSQPTGPASSSKTCESKISPVFYNVPRKDGSTESTNTISPENLLKQITGVTQDRRVGVNAFIFPFLFYYGRENVNTYVANNLYNFILESSNNQKLLGGEGLSWDENTSYIDGCLCYQLGDKSVVPMATFDSFNKSIRAFVDLNKVWIQKYMKDPTISGTTYDIEPSKTMTEENKAQLLSSIQNCWKIYYEKVGGTVTESQNSTISDWLNKYLSLL